MKHYLGFQCCISEAEGLWFSSFRGNGLFCYNGENVEYITSFREKGVKLFNDIVKYENKLFFIPLAANNIYTYDLISREVGTISYKNPTIGDFVFAIVYERYIYMFPSFHSGILKLDSDTFDIEIIDNWIDEEFMKCRLSDEPYFRGDYVREGETVYVPFCNAHAILEFHLDNGNSKVHDVGRQSYATIASDGKRFWMAPRKGGGIVSWNLATGKIVEYMDYPEGFQEGAFIGSLYWDGHVWMFPESANMVLKVNVNTGEIVEEQLFSDICNHKWNAYSVWNAAFIYMRRQETNQVLLCSGRSSEIVIFNYEKKEIEQFRLPIPDEAVEFCQEEPDERYLVYREKRKNSKKERGYFHESVKYGIEEFIEDIEKDDIRTAVESDSGSGERIFRYIASNFGEGNNVW